MTKLGNSYLQPVSNGVDGLDDDLVERRALRHFGRLDGLHPRPPHVLALVKHVVVHRALLGHLSNLEARVQDLHTSTQVKVCSSLRVAIHLSKSMKYRQMTDDSHALPVCPFDPVSPTVSDPHLLVHQLAEEDAELGPALVLRGPSNGPDEGEDEDAVQHLEDILGRDLLQGGWRDPTAN